MRITLYIFLFKQSCLLSVTHWAFRFHLADLAGFGCRCFLGVRGCSSLSPLECQDENPEEKMEENVMEKTGWRRARDLIKRENVVCFKIGKGNCKRWSFQIRQRETDCVTGTSGSSGRLPPVTRPSWETVNCASRLPLWWLFASRWFVYNTVASLLCWQIHYRRQDRTLFWQLQEAWQVLGCLLVSPNVFFRASLNHHLDDSWKLTTQCTAVVNTSLSCHKAHVWSQGLQQFELLPKSMLID